MLRQLPMRQRIRKTLVIVTFLSFPITMNFLSPYVIIDGATNGIVNNCTKKAILYSFSKSNL
jgi:hypothetical protein